MNNDDLKQVQDLLHAVYNMIETNTVKGLWDENQFKSATIMLEGIISILERHLVPEGKKEEFDALSNKPYELQTRIGDYFRKS